MEMPRTNVTVKLVGGDGNSFVILGKVVEALRAGGYKDLVDEYTKEATSGDYDHLLATSMDYVHVT